MHSDMMLHIILFSSSYKHLQLLHKLEIKFITSFLFRAGIIRFHEFTVRKDIYH